MPYTYVHAGSPIFYDGGCEYAATKRLFTRPPIVGNRLHRREPPPLRPDLRPFTCPQLGMGDHETAILKRRLDCIERGSQILAHHFRSCIEAHRRYYAVLLE